LVPAASTVTTGQIVRHTATFGPLTTIKGSGLPATPALTARRSLIAARTQGQPHVWAAIRDHDALAPHVWAAISDQRDVHPTFGPRSEIFPGT
jgi:hypothetical protein